MSKGRAASRQLDEMPNTSEPSEYLFLMRGADWDDSLPVDEAKVELDKMMSWAEALAARGVMLSGQPLFRRGRIVSAKPSGMVMDGAFTETKEVFGGYLILRACSLDEAV